MCFGRFCDGPGFKASAGKHAGAEANTDAMIAPTTANAADVSSVDAIIKAVYDVISGPAGKKRDWDRMRSLFIPGARLIATGPRRGGGYGARVMTVDDYIIANDPYLLKKDFLKLKSLVRRNHLDRLCTRSALMSRGTNPRRNPSHAASTVFN